MLDREFTSSELERRVSNANASILHLATHGQFSSDPERTFLLAWDKRVSIGELGLWLKARNVERTRAFDLLILSACQTAVGDDRAALGLAGLAVQSGATSTIATLWGVNDESTAQLMQQLYAFIAQEETLSKSESLRQAQLTLLRDPKYQHPYHWAPFVLVGNWQ